MGYLFDSDALITSNNTWYPIDYCPAFWDLLLRANAEGDALSIEKVYEEIKAGDDRLSEWVDDNKDFFVTPDNKTMSMYKSVVEHVHLLSNPPITDSAKRFFLGGADPFLIAHAAAHDHTVVTCEVEAAVDCKKVKIPNVCKAFSVPFIHPMNVLRELQACFVLENNT